MKLELVDQYSYLKNIFTIESLQDIFESNKIKQNNVKGIDRLNIRQFRKIAPEQIAIIHEKCLIGNYKFSPYVEILHSKGRNKNPRPISVPTVRDRIVLRVLTDILSEFFPEAKPKKLANTYIHEISKGIIGNDKISDFGVLKLDITNFYGSINREKLIAKLKSKIEVPELLKLIIRAIETPTVPRDYHKQDLKKYKENQGIPQGLSISNILSSIYIHELDQLCNNNTSFDLYYYRYVDDILIITSYNDLSAVKNLIKNKINELGLTFHDNNNPDKDNNNSDKLHLGKVNEKFDYLGYSFEFPKITVRQYSIDKFISSIASKFSDYSHNKLSRLTRHKYLTLEKLKEVFVLELNEKITGAIDGSRRYGWIFYFNAINDLSILYMIDKVILSFFDRNSDFSEMNDNVSLKIKKLSKAFYEAKYNPMGGYIHNYNNYKNINQKRDFLSQWGKIDNSQGLSEMEIHKLYEQTKFKNLSQLEKDDAIIY